MDGFTVGVLFWFASVIGAFGLGQWWPQDTLLQGCDEQNEMVIRNTVVYCKPTAMFLNGKRIEIKQ